jgi:glycosyltransferase involved in cell wall biosynthesis
MIAIVYPEFYGVGGIARYLDSLLANLPAGHPPIVLVTGDEHRTERRYAGVEIVHVRFKSTRWSLLDWALRVRRMLLRLHREGKISVVNLHWPPLIPGLALPRGIPLVLTAHTTYLGMSGRFYAERHFESQWNASSLAIKSWMERRILANATRVIALTEQGRQEIARYGFKGPIDVIPNGVDLRAFTPSPCATKDIDVLFCGRIEARKGSRALVECCRRLVTARPATKICVVGHGDDEEFVRAQLAPLASNVVVTGKVPFERMIAYYDRSRVYASTSYYEGLPGTCLESMAMQLPVAVWDLPFYRSLVVHGRTGLVAPPNDFAAFCDAILALLGNEPAAAALGRSGRALLAESYDWSKLAGAVVGVLRDAASGSAGPAGFHWPPQAERVPAGRGAP